MKILLLLSVFLSSVFSQTVLCYKNNIVDANLNINIKLSGEECKDKFTVNDMKNNGWTLDDSKIVQNNSSTYNHIYIFKKETNITYQPKVKSKHLNKLNLKMASFKISNVSKNQATINIGNLIVGQSGIILHPYSNKNTVILATAIVKKTSNNSSTLVLSNNTLLAQDALPTTSLKARNGDIFILNHLYNSSLLIVPNYETSQSIKNIYSGQNFVNPDLFAAFLKISNKPVPKQKDFQEFCKSQDIGTIYIAVENNFYIIDVNSFKILKKTRLRISDTTTQTPFFTKVEDIKKSFWSFWNSDAKKIEDYNSFYLALINNTIYLQNKDVEQSFLSKVKDMLPW